jgi:Xaa-Pro dipeptidase
MERALADAYRDHVAHLVSNVQPLLVEAGFDRLVVYAGDLARKNRFDDQDWPFQPIPMFRWFSPLAWPQSVLVLPAKGEPVLYAVRSDSFWERPTEPDWGFLQAGLTVEQVGSLTDVKAMGWHGRSAYIGQEPQENLTSPTAVVNPGTLVERLNDLRTRKTPYEVECLARASARAVKGHLRAREAFFSGERSELAIHLTYLAATEQDDAQTPYKNIVALGRNAATLHHVEYGAPDPADTMLIDAGASWGSHGSDITRTWVRGEDEAADRFRRLVSAVEDVQQAVIAEARPGVEYEALHDGAHEKLGRVLVEHGLVTCSAEAADAEGITRVFFPHGLGHSLGVQVHDVGCLVRAPGPRNPYLRNTKMVEAGQVFTVEPGLYFIDALLESCRAGPAGRSVDWNAVEALRPFGGIRIEDDVHVTGDGVRNLTREAFAAAA